MSSFNAEYGKIDERGAAILLDWSLPIVRSRLSIRLFNEWGPNWIHSKATEFFLKNIQFIYIYENGVNLTIPNDLHIYLFSIQLVQLEPGAFQGITCWKIIYKANALIGLFLPISQWLWSLLLLLEWWKRKLQSMLPSKLIISFNLIQI